MITDNGERVVITLLHGDPITLTGPDMWAGWQRAVESRAQWVNFHVVNGAVAIQMAHVVSALHVPPPTR